jgi:hypothetical protein
VTIRRFICAFLVFLWASAPVFACLPSATMTDAEMACCRKMAGDCDMGAGNHSCCKNAMNRAEALPAVVLASQAQAPTLLVKVSGLVVDSSPEDARDNLFVTLLAPPVSPPGSHSILRI